MATKKKAAAASPNGSPKKGRPKKGETSKAALVRAAKKAEPHLTVAEIAEKVGTTVNNVYQALRNVTKKKAKAVKRSSGAGNGVEIMRATADFVRAAGGYEQASAVLEAAKTLHTVG